MKFWPKNDLAQSEKVKKGYSLRKERDKALEKARTKTSCVMFLYLPGTKRWRVEIKIEKVDRLKPSYNGLRRSASSLFIFTTPRFVPGG